MTRLIVLAALIPAFSQGSDVAFNAGAGVTKGEHYSASAAEAGASAGFPLGSKNKFQIDYSFQNGYTELANDRHFLTGSYVIQQRSGRAPWFFQVGAGMVHTRSGSRSYYSDGVVVSRIEKDTSLAILLGFGSTVYVGNSFFIRPQFRLYGHVGPTLTFLPSIGVGWRF